MAEILTESFCERCGSRYTFEVAAARRRGLGRIRTLSRGLKNFVANDDASFSDALALAREEDDRKASLQQLDAFHRTFNFCMTCRQYTCRNCWNAAAGECLSCAPDLSREVLPPAFPDLTVVRPEPAIADSAELRQPRPAPTAWPSTDLPVDVAPPTVLAVLSSPAAGAALDVVAEPDVAGVDETALAAPAEGAPLAEIPLAIETTPATAGETLAAAGAAVAGEIPLAIEAAPGPLTAPDFAAEVDAPVTAEAGLEAAPGYAAESEAAVLPEPVREHERAPEVAAAAASGPVDESGLDLTATERAAVEGALHRQVQRAEPAAAETGRSDAAPASEIGPTGQPEPAVPGQAETGRFFQRFRLLRGRPAAPASAIEAARQGEAAVIAAATPEPEPVAAVIEAAAPQPEPVAAGVAPVAPQREPEPLVAAVEAGVAAVAPEPEPLVAAVEARVAAVSPEPEPELVIAAVAAAASEAVPEPEPLAVEVEAEPEPEPAAVEVAASAGEITPKPEPVHVAAAPVLEPEAKPVDVVTQPTWQIVAPDGTGPGEAEPAPPIWTNPPAVTRRPAEPMPTAAWASRVATARPVESPVWVASSRDVVAVARPGVAAPVGVHSCVSCGLSLSANARFCRRCGSRQG